MRILTLVHEYPPVGGGGGRVAQDVARGLAARGHEVRVFTAHHGDLPRRELDGGVEVLRLRSCRREAFRADLKAMGCYVTAAVLAGLRVVRRWKPGVIHAHFAVPAGAAAWALSRLTRTPYVLTAHLGDVPGGAPEKTGRWFRWIFPFTKPIWRGAARITAVSEFTRRLAQEHYPVEVRVIPNGVDVEALKPRDFRLHNPPHILFAGRFMPQKNPLQVVRVLSRLQSLPWRCTMMGDGPLLEQTKAVVSENGLDDRFTFTGWITPQEVLAQFDEGDILFMPSRSEGLPVVGVQALAKGLAVVAGKVGGFLDVVADGENGFLIPPEDADAAAEALRSLLTDSNRLFAFRKASLRRARRFDLSEVVAAYEETLSQALPVGGEFSLP